MIIIISYLMVLIMKLKKRIKRLIKMGVMKSLIISNEICNRPDVLMFDSNLMVDYISFSIILIRKLEYHSF